MTKVEIHQVIFDWLENHITNLHSVLAGVTDGAAGEGKSSAGDKHETSAAMLHLEQEKLAKQLADFNHMRPALATLNPNDSHRQIQLGSLVRTNRGTYYISIPVGAVACGESRIFAVSATAPLVQMLIGKQAGDVVVFNGISTQILEVN